MREKSNLLDIRRLHEDLIIRHREDETAVNCGASKRVESFIEALQRNIIEFRHGIQTSIVHAHPPVAVFLSNHHDWRCPRRCRRAPDVSRHELHDFRHDRGANFTVRQAADGLTKGTHIAGIYLVKRQICSADI